MSMSQVNLMHTLLLGPSMIYIGRLDDNELSNLDNKTIDLIFNAVIAYSLLIPFIVRNQFLEKSISEWDTRNLINFMHYWIFMGLFYYIGRRGRSITKIWRIISLIIGLSVISIHIYFLLKN